MFEHYTRDKGNQPRYLGEGLLDAETSCGVHVFAVSRKHQGSSNNEWNERQEKR